LLKWLIIPTIAFFIIQIMSGCARSRGVIKLEFSSFFPVHDGLSILMQEWCSELEKRTDGRVRVNYYPAGILTPAAQTFDSVVTGIADIGLGPTGVTPGRFPLAEVMEQPLGISSSYHMTRLANDFFRNFKPKEFDDVKVLFLLNASPGLLHTKKPVRKLEDLKGMKIRCLGKNAAAVLKSLGSVPVMIPTGDTYDALRKGIVDGVIAACDSLETMKWGELLPFTTVCYFAAIGSPGFVVMNKTKWKDLRPDIQKIIDEMSNEYAEKVSLLWDDKDRRSIEKWKARGHTFIYLDKEEEERWAKAIVPLYEVFVKEKSAQGLPAIEALEFCRQWGRVNGLQLVSGN